MGLAYEMASMAVVDFAQFMWRETKEMSWLDVIVELLLNPLCHIEGAYSMAVFYAKELLKRCHTVENLEQMLFFSELPEEVLSEAEARNIARQILAQDPENEKALTICRINEYGGKRCRSL